MSEKRLGMLLDLSLCIGCNACVVACKYENGVPADKFNTWIESFDVERPDGRIARANVPKQCNHCEDAPCVRVCPTGASYKAEDGTVQVDPEKCIGCKYCMAACPYQARYQLESGEVEKCTFCHHRSSQGMLPACVATCVTHARYFGDLNDPDSDISKKLAEKGGEALYADLGLNPSVCYIGLSETNAMPEASAVHRGGNVIKPYEGVN